MTLPRAAPQFRRTRTSGLSDAAAGAWGRSRLQDQGGTCHAQSTDGCSLSDHAGNGYPRARHGRPGKGRLDPDQARRVRRDGRTGGGADKIARFIATLVKKHNLFPVEARVVNMPAQSGSEALSYMKNNAGNDHLLMFTLNSFFTVPIEPTQARRRHPHLHPGGAARSRSISAVGAYRSGRHQLGRRLCSGRRQGGRLDDGRNRLDGRGRAAHNLAELGHEAAHEIPAEGRRRRGRPPAGGGHRAVDRQQPRGDQHLSQGAAGEAAGYFHAGAAGALCRYADVLGAGPRDRVPDATRGGRAPAHERRCRRLLLRRVRAGLQPAGVARLQGEQRPDG